MSNPLVIKARDPLSNRLITVGLVQGTKSLFPSLLSEEVKYALPSAGRKRNAKYSLSAKRERAGKEHVGIVGSQLHKGFVFYEKNQTALPQCAIN
jgi:hypothetical protein